MPDKYVNGIFFAKSAKSLIIKELAGIKLKGKNF
jgi:hypothetical protein